MQLNILIHLPNYKITQLNFEAIPTAAKVTTIHQIIYKYNLLTNH